MRLCAADFSQTGLCLHFYSCFLENDRRLRGSLEGNPKPGDRLRFVFVFVSCVACVRAGEAKLQVRARCRVFLLGRPLRWEVLLLRSRPLCEAQDVGYTSVLKQNGSKSVPRCAHCVCFTLVLRRSFMKHVNMALSFMLNPLKTHAWCISCRKNLVKTRV